LFTVLYIVYQLQSLSDNRRISRTCTFVRRFSCYCRWRLPCSRKYVIAIKQTVDVRWDLGAGRQDDP